TSGEATAAANAVRAYWEAMKGFLAAPNTITVQPDVPSVDVATGSIIENFVTTTVAVSATVATEPLPFANQALVQLRTGDYVGGRELRGRWFIPGQLESGSTNGRLTAAWRSALLSQTATFLTAASAGGGIVVWSPTHGVASNVNAHGVWDEFAVLRSRRP
ncbi:MAG: hypothetical protein O7C59_10075, partial [Rickettsia endosymbiont of Ixodes persulcatus]|nr:hypothetical protein [Rickettsia endosymbiont of Ixodes persulcatus]